MRKHLAILLILLLAIPIFGQSGTAGRIRYGTSLPATCSPLTGDVFFLTTGSIGLYTCISANTWIIPVATTTVNTGLAVQVIGITTPTQLIYNIPSNNSFTLVLTGSQCKATVAATAQTDFLVKVNGTLKATLRFASSATTCTVVSPVSTSIVSGDVITITGPATPDLTLANIGINLKVSIP